MKRFLFAIVCFVAFILSIMALMNRAEHARVMNRDLEKARRNYEAMPPEVIAPLRVGDRVTVHLLTEADDDKLTHGKQVTLKGSADDTAVIRHISGKTAWIAWKFAGDDEAEAYVEIPLVQLKRKE